MEDKEWKRLEGIWMPHMKTLASKAVERLPEKMGGAVYSVTGSESYSLKRMDASGGNMQMSVGYSADELLHFWYKDNLKMFEFESDFLKVSSRALYLNNNMPKRFNFKYSAHGGAISNSNMLVSGAGLEGDLELFMAFVKTVESRPLG
jgi:hypothetical protein